MRTIRYMGINFGEQQGLNKSRESLKYCRLCGLKVVQSGFLCGSCLGMANSNKGTSEVSEGYRETVRCLLALQTGMRVSFPGENPEIAASRSLDFKSLAKWIRKYGRDNIHGLIADYMTDDTRGVREIAEAYGFCRENIHYLAKQINLPPRRLTLTLFQPEDESECRVNKRHKVTEWFLGHRDFINNGGTDVTREDLFGRVMDETGLTGLSAATFYRGLSEARVSV